EVIDRRMVVRDEPVEGRLRARLQLVDEFGFIAAPTQGTSQIGHCRPFRLAAGGRATLLIGPTFKNALGVRTLYPGTTCVGDQDRAVPDVRSLSLDTRGSRVVSPERKEFSYLCELWHQRRVAQWDWRIV